MRIIVNSKIYIFCIIFFLIGFVGLEGDQSNTLTLAQMNEASQSTNLLTYDNPNQGYSLKYPADWSKEETLLFTSPPQSPNETLSALNEAPESVAVTTEVLPSNITLDEYSESAMNLVESQFPNFTLIDSFDTTLSGYPAHQITYTYTMDDLGLKNMQIWTIADNNTAYALTYGGIIKEFDSSLPVIQNMINSFKVSEIQQ